MYILINKENKILIILNHNKAITMANRTREYPIYTAEILLIHLTEHL